MKTGALTLKTLAVRSAFTVATLGLMLVFPQAFHLFGLGAAFLPMFLPLVAAAVLKGTGFPLVVPALAAPFLSLALFGMPAWPVAAAIAAEMTFLAVALSRARGLRAAFYPVFPVMLAGGRAVSFAVHAGILFLLGRTAPTAAAWSVTLAGWKGLLICLLTGFALYAISRFADRNAGRNER